MGDIRLPKRKYINVSVINNNSQRVIINHFTYFFPNLTSIQAKVEINIEIGIEVVNNTTAKCLCTPFPSYAAGILNKNTEIIKNGSSRTTHSPT